MSIYIDCPRCKKKALPPGLYCTNCGFVPIDEDENRFERRKFKKWIRKQNKEWMSS
jgi:hypothetical protein